MQVELMAASCTVKGRRGDPVCRACYIGTRTDTPRRPIIPSIATFLWPGLKRISQRGLARVIVDFQSNVTLSRSGGQPLDPFSFKWVIFPLFFF